METLGVDRPTAIKIDKGLIAPSTNEKGEPILIDKVTNTSTPVNTISSQLNESLAISSSGEDVVANNVPQFLVDPPDVVEKAYSSGTKDDVPALLLAGEFVHTRDANEGLGKMMGAKNKDEAARMGIEAQYQLMNAFERMA